MLEAMEKRISRRTFKKEELTKEEVKTIITLINELNKESNLAFEFIEDGSDAFSSLIKSYGIFSNVHSLVLLKGKKEQDLKEKCGYYGEELVLNLTNLNLGTCWVGATFDKNKFTIEDDEELVGLIVLGKVDEMSLKERIISSTLRKRRKPITDRLITDDTIPEWLEKGMEYVLLAPSAKNTQKPLFSYKNKVLTVSVPDDYEFDLVDLGSANKHFEFTGGKFEVGNPSKYNLK